MTCSNGFKVVRIKNPHPKQWPGPWFAMGRELPLSGCANWKMLWSYIGTEAYIEVRKHFRCLDPFPLWKTSYGEMTRKKRGAK